MQFDNLKLQKWARQFERQLLSARRRRDLFPEEVLRWEVETQMQLQRLRGIDAGLRVAQELMDLASSNLYECPDSLKAALKSTLDRNIDAFASGKA